MLGVSGSVPGAVFVLLWSTGQSGGRSCLVVGAMSTRPLLGLCPQGRCWGYVHKAVVDVVEDPQAGQSVVLVAQDLSTEVQIAKHGCTSA